jgi:hypothetical protein
MMMRRDQTSSTTSGVFLPIRRQIRTDDEIEAATLAEIRVEKMKLESSREDDQAREKPKTPLTQQKILSQPPPRPKSREIPERLGRGALL